MNIPDLLTYDPVWRLKYKQLIIGLIRLLAVMLCAKTMISILTGYFYESRLVYSDVVEQRVNLFRVQPTYKLSHLSELPDLQKLNWPRPFVSSIPTISDALTGKPAVLQGSFEPSMSIRQLKLHRKLLRTFSDIMFTNGYGDRFMLSGGTLAGSFHHHDFVPWEDEISLLVDITIRNRVRELVEKTMPQYRIFTANKTDKFFAQPLNTTRNSGLGISRPVTGRAWSWPYVDISYYVVNKTHVSQSRQAEGNQISWPIETVFPLYFRPFGPAWYPAPRDPLRFLRTLYGGGIFCNSLSWSHSLEVPMTVITTRCRSLVYRYPFVYHDICDGYVGLARGDMALSMERLVNLPEFPEFSAVHGFCLAAPVENTRAESYFYGCRTE